MMAEFHGILPYFQVGTNFRRHGEGVGGGKKPSEDMTWSSDNIKKCPHNALGHKMSSQQWEQFQVITIYCTHSYGTKSAVRAKIHKIDRTASTIH